MDLIQIAWPMMGGACVTLGLIHLLLWSRQHGEPTHLWFAFTAFAVGSFSVTELMLMQARTPAEYTVLLRWLHVPGAIMFISLAVFVRLRFATSRAWLCWLIIALRAGAVLANFTTGQNINFTEITGLHFVDLGGGLAGAVPEGRLNPWMALGQASNLLLVAYLVDAVWRTRRLASPAEFGTALRICGSAAIFIVLSNFWHAGVVAGLIDAPDMLVPSFLCVILIMSRELVGEVLRAGQLARDLLRSETRLLENERRMGVAVRAAEIGLWSWDAGTRELWLSDLGEQLLGFALGAGFDREGFRARLLEQDRGRIGRCYRDALAGDGDLRCEFQLQLPDGEWRWLVIRGQVYRGAPGSPERTYGIVADITERRRQEERFRLAVEASPIATLLIAPGGAIALANAQAERVFQYRREELLAMHADDLMPAQLQPNEQRLCDAHGPSTGQRVLGMDQDLRILRKDGRVVPVEVALSPIRIDDQVFKLASVVDISERRRLEAESALQRDELAHLSRVALLAELSGSLAHELNQPLTAILSNAQAAMRFLAMDPPDLAEVRESLVNIVESDKRGGEVIRRLRAMLRKEASDFRALDINEVVLDVLRIIRSDLLNRSTEVVLELAPGLPAVVGDSIQLQQVLLNLIMNGCDAMAELQQDRELRVRTELRPEGIELVVSDVGRGIPPERLREIFAPFVSTKREGMGLGLAVCSTIIDSHQGRIWATNNPDRGASLHVLLPIAEPVSDA